ncbi:MAG TPA: hypothetical protein VES97_07385 [Solirubrobacteraceae bacterium]|nr:hypothetical protein [Solirubrobacteraceae bacterium]
MRLAAPLLAAVCAAALAGCGDTLQDQPIPHNLLENLIGAPDPVYWLGGSFQGLAVTEATHDPSGAFSVQYGDCLEGGQSSCVPPLRVVSTPDNSFLPTGSSSHAAIEVRGVAAVVASGGRAIEIPTGGVVVDIYARDPRLADAAAQTIVPINGVGSPQAPLPARLPDTGFGEAPLPSQIPSPLRAIR